MIPIHPLIAFEHLSLYIQKHLGVVTTNSKLGRQIFFFQIIPLQDIGKLLYIVWKTLTNVSNDSFDQRIASAHNCDSIRTQRSSIQKAPLYAPSRGSL